MFPDSDGDGIVDSCDACSFFPNTLPLLVNPFNGIPCECLCGDFDGDCSLSATDAARVNGCAAFVRVDCVSERDDVDLDGRITATDASLINRVGGFALPAYTLECVLRPEGTCGGDTGVSCDF